MHVEDRWTTPTGTVDLRGRPVRERTDRYGSGLRWMATWTEQGKRKTKSFPSKDAANAHLGSVAKAQRDGTHVHSHKMTVAEFGDDWIRNQIHQRASTREQMEIRWRKYIRPALGHLLIRETRSAHVQAAVNRWAAELAPATIAVTYGYVAAIFKIAVRDRLVAATPCADINLPPMHSGKVVPLTKDQVHLIAERITPRYRALVLLGAATGMRSGELRGVTGDRIRWDDTAAIRVDRQLTTTQPKWGPPKTRSGDRTVSIDGATAQLLRDHIAAYPPHSSGLIFTGREGGPLARTSVTHAWREATKGMNLPDRSGLHALRHFHASMLIAAGLSVTAVADRLGHKDSTETLSTYAHLWPNDEARSRDAIAAGLWG